MSSGKLVVGLTGGIGSGKTTVSDLFADRGVNIIDTDRLTRELTEPGQLAYKAILERFGPHFLLGNKHLNRMKLRKLIFSDTNERLWLEQLLHPLVRQEIARQLEHTDAPYSIVVIPLFFETDPNPLIQRILVVDAPEELQIARTQARDVQLPIDVEAIMKTQVSREKRLAGASDIIVNSGTREELIPQVDKLHQFYLSLSQGT